MLWLLSAGAARAADQPRYAPAGAWVTPIAAAKPAATPDGAAIRLMLADSQNYFGPDADEYYLHSVIQIQR